MKPWVASCWNTWLRAVRSSSIGGASWNSGAGRPWATSATSGTDGICIACAIDGAASMSTLPSRNLPSNSLARVCRSAARPALSGERVGL